MLSIAILDDNIKVLEQYENLLPTWFDKNGIKGRVVAATSDYTEFISVVRDRSVNVCIIDINLQSEVNGLYVAKRIRRENLDAEIIFCTGLLEYMHDAFDVNAYHFILKPIGRNLERCLVKLNREIEARQKKRGVLEIRTKSRIYYIPHDTISHIIKSGAKTSIYWSGNVLEVNESLDSIISRLDPERFVKCSRSQILNKDFIEYIDRKKRTVMLANGYEGRIGRSGISSIASGKEL